LSSTVFDQFLQKWAQRRSSTLLIVPTFKISKTQKSKMAAAAIFENRKIAMSQQRLDRAPRNLAQ